MPYDLFISYSRRDNERGQVAALNSQIESSFRAFAGRGLRVFFDTQEIAGMDDWRQKIQRSLRESQVFLAVLSPHYLASPYCRWEWEDYVRYEAMRQCLGEGVAPVFFVTLPEAADATTDQAIARWIDEIHRRQTFDLRPWHDSGEQALRQAHVRQTLEQLHASLRERLDRAERSRSSPNNLIRHNPAFVGRVRELTELRQALTKNKLGVVGAREGQMPGLATVQGLGGMGKTELALAYAHAFAWDYPGGRWQIPCDHLSDLRVALLHLANTKALNFEFSENENKDIVLAFERLLRELNRRERCLLILDNVSDPNLLQPEYLDRLPRDGRVDLIATTRLAPRAIPGSALEQSFIAVDELPEEDALALMRSHQPGGRFASQQEDDEARAIERLLRGFTLAVETAAIYLGRDTAPDACRRFRERLSPDLLRESETAATDPAVAVRHRVRSLEETLAFTLQTLTPEAMHLLTIASLLPADQIALPWLKTVGAQRPPALAAAPSEPTSEFRQAEELLLGVRLFQSSGVVDDDGHLLVVQMHRLVQELVAQRNGLEKEQVLAALVGHAKVRCHFLHDDGWVDAMNRWELAPLVACSTLWLTRDVSDGAYLAHEMATVFQKLGDERTAKRLYAAARSRVNESGPLSAPDPNHAALLSNEAEMLDARGESERAMEMRKQALAIYRLSLGNQHQFVATACINVAKSCVRVGRLDEAEELVAEAVAIDETIYGPEHPEVASDLSVQAAILQQRGDLNVAEVTMRRILRIYRRSLPDNHPQIAVALNNLAALMIQQQKPAQAEPLLRDAIAINRACLGSQHPDLATRLNNLALALRAAGKLKDALEPAQEALRVLVAHSKETGHPHAGIQAAVNTLGGLALESGLPDPIVRHFINGILRPLQSHQQEAPSEGDSTTRTLKPDPKADPAKQSQPASPDRDTAIEHLNLAVALEAQGEHEEAVVWYRKAADQGSAPAQFNLGVHLANGVGCKQDEAEAVKWYREASHQGYVNAVYNLAFMLENGYGCPRDLRLAFELYLRAANDREPDSQYKIASLLLDQNLQERAGFDYGRGRGDSLSAISAGFRKLFRGASGKLPSNTPSSDDAARPPSWAFVPIDHQKARELLQDAASRGHSHSARLLRTLGWS